jgi:DNA-binding MarR family transcriptional regulator
MAPWLSIKPAPAAPAIGDVAPDQLMPEIGPGANPLFLREDELRRGFDMLFYAWRDLSAVTDAELQRHGLGRAHQRALYFIARRPGLPVGELVALLGITKQSLGRVLKDLAARGLTNLAAGPLDRRERRLTLSPAGAELEQRLFARQRAVLADAYRRAGAEAVEGFRKVLAGLQRKDPGRAPGSFGTD